MSWLRIDDGFTSNSKVAQLTDSEFRCWMRLLCHCAKSQDPSVDDVATREVSGLSRGRVERFKTLDLLDQIGPNYEIHGWTKYLPKDTPTERQAGWRARKAAQAASTGASTNGSTDASTEMSTSHTGARGSTPVPSRPTNSLPLSNYDERVTLEIDDQEQARQQAWLERSRKPDVRSPQGFYSAGVRSGSWPDPFEQEVGVKANASAEGPGAVAAMIRNGVLTDRVELEAELEHVEPADRAGLVAQFELAAPVRENGAAGEGEHGEEEA